MLLGVLQGIVVAIVLAVLLYFRRGWQPRGSVLGQVEGLAGWHSVEEYPEARELPGIVVYRWEAPLFFANCSAFRSQVRRLSADRHPSGSSCSAKPSPILTFPPRMLEQLDRELNGSGTHMAFVEMRSRLQDQVQRYGLLETLDGKRFYPTLDAGLAVVHEG